MNRNNVTIYADDATLVSYGENEQSVLLSMDNTILKAERQFNNNL